MRKIIRKIAVLLTLTFFSLILTSCTDKVLGIAIDETSIPDHIVVGTFDITDLNLVVTKGNYQTETIPVTISMISATDFAKLSNVGTHEIAITYLGFTIKVTLKIEAPSDQDIETVLQSDLAEIAIPAVMSDLFVLPLNGTHGSTISWETDSSALTVSTGGTVTLTRPLYFEEDLAVTLTATLEYYGKTLSQTFDTLIPKRNKDDVDEQIESVAFGLTLPELIDNTLNLPFNVPNISGLKIEWASNNPEIIVINNPLQTVQVLSPETDTPVTLSFTIHYQNRSYSHFDGFTVIVKKGTTPAPAVTDLSLDGSILSWTGVEGAESYAVYVDGALVKIVENSFVDLDTVIDSDGRYTIGIQTNPFGSYAPSLIVEIPYQQIPSHVEAYYRDLDFALVGNALKMELRELITVTHTTKTSYASLRQHLQYTDASLTDDSKILLFYSRIEVDKTWDNGATYNREHVWAQSLGWFTESGAGSDLHHIRPTDPSVNSSVNNRKFGNVEGGKQINLSKKNGEGLIDGFYKGDLFEPADEVKGDVARIIFYLMTRYPESDSYSFTSVASSLELLLEWNALDPVDEFEARRNDRTWEIQGNRNPFIDFSFLADQIWG